MFDVQSNKWADVYTIKEFGEMVKCGAFIPSDGCGYFGSETHFAYEFDVWSLLKDLGRRPKEATHVHWFNK